MKLFEDTPGWTLIPSQVTSLCFKTNIVVTGHDESKSRRKPLVSISKYQREMLCFDLKPAYEPTRAVWFAIIKL